MLNGTVDATDRRLSVDVTLYNQGNASVTEVEQRVTIINASQDVVFETYEYDIHIPGSISTLEWTLDLSNPLPAGDYTFKLTVDSIPTIAAARIAFRSRLYSHRTHGWKHHG